MSPPYMPLYIADYLSATEHLDAAHSGAYLHLIMHYWQKGKLPSEDRFLARIARMTDRQWASARSTLQAFFTSDWRHERIDLELDKASKKAEARAACGSRGGHSKALNNNTSTLAKASDLPEQTPSKPPSKPLASSSGLESNSEASASEKRARKDAFNRFWQSWPNKVGKPTAEAAFAKHFLEIDAIMAGLERYIRDKPPDRSWLNPATFLNQRRWEDQPANPILTNGKSVHAAAQRLCDDVASGAVVFAPPPLPYVLAERRDREREEATRLLSQRRS